MSLNCIEIEEVVKTIPKNGIIKKIYQPEKNIIDILIFDGNRNVNLLINIMDKYNHIVLLINDFNKKKDIKRFGQILNAHLTGGRLNNIYQYNLSRIIILEIIISNVLKKIVCRLWGSGANILLLDAEDKIIDVLRRMPGRYEWPGEKFSLAEKDNKKPVKYKLRDFFKGDDINSLIYDYYFEIINNENFFKKKNELTLLLNKELDKTKLKLKKIDNNISTEREEEYKKYGELLKANIYKIKRGEINIELLDFYTNKQIKVSLKKDLSPSENAERYFTKYKKIKKGRLKWENEKSLLIKKQENIEKSLQLLKKSLCLEELYEQEKMIFNIIKSNIKNQNTSTRIFYRKFYLDSDFTAFVSKSAKDVDKLLNRIASGNDYWFHVRDFTGSHVIVKHIKGKQITENAVLEAATLAMYYSKCRNQDTCDIHFTHVKYLHKSKGGPKGLVFPTQEKNISLKFDENILNRVLSK